MAQLEPKFNALADFSDCMTVSSGELGTPDQDQRFSPASGKLDASSSSELRKRRLEQSAVHGPQSVMGWVYFIRCEAGPIKIGWSSDMRKRLEMLQNMSPFTLELLGQVRAPKIAERRIHRHFDEIRLHGEWFKDDGEVAEFARTAIADGLPDWATAPAFGRPPKTAKSIKLSEMVKACAEPVSSGETVKDQITRAAAVLQIDYWCARRLWYGLGGPAIYERIAPVYERVMADRRRLSKGRG